MHLKSDSSDQNIALVQHLFENATGMPTTLSRIPRSLSSNLMLLRVTWNSLKC